jgi:hypothetical protein
MNFNIPRHFFEYQHHTIRQIMLLYGEENFQLIFSVKKILHSLTTSKDGLKTLNIHQETTILLILYEGNFRSHQMLDFGGYIS